MRISDWKRSFLKTLGLMTILTGVAWNSAVAQIVPGTGYKVEQVGDNFEDESWSWTPNWPKSSQNLDGDARYNLGESSNARWIESTYRGQPDIIKRVPTPPGGIAGSKGSLLLKTKFSGIPDMITRKQQQDDFLANVSGITGAIPVNHAPSVVARVYLPPWDQWEQRTGATFGFRADCEGTLTKTETKKGLFGTRQSKTVKQDAYWPGFFVQYNCKRDSGQKEDSALVLIRSDEQGRDLFGPVITQPGWWTFGMSFTPDGRVHYYASPGVDRLTQADFITSQSPYGSNTQQFITFFFNVVNPDDGQTWSTGWIVDDPEVYVLHKWW